MKNEVKEGDNQMVVQENPVVNLLEMAIKEKASIEYLDKLMDLKERHDRNEAAKSFKVSMVSFQKEKPVILKTKGVSFGQGKTAYKYAPLSKIQQAVDPILSKFGISYRWERTQSGDLLTNTCVVSHISGHEERTTMTGPNDTSGNKNSIQSIGSSSTYLDRYTLTGALGLSYDEDNDGNGRPKTQTDIDKDAKFFTKFKDQVGKCNTLDELELLYTSLPDNQRLLKTVVDEVNSMKDLLSLKK